MALTVSQVGRTSYENYGGGIYVDASITISIYKSAWEYATGWEQYRKTYIKLAGLNGYYALEEALNLGYISSFNVSGDTNGTITISFPQNQITGQLGNRAWEIRVGAIHYDHGYEIEDETKLINVFLKFDWSVNQTKYSGFELDLALNDIERLDEIATDIRAYVMSSTAYTYIEPNGVYASNVLSIANKIYDSASSLTDSILPNKQNIINDMTDVINAVYATGMVYAWHINYLRNAINTFDMTV